MSRLTKGYDRKICGVCSGLANYFNIDPTIMRIIYTFLTLFSFGFLGLVLYAFLAVIMKDPE